MMKKSSFGSRVRKRLSDITNMHSLSKSPLKDQDNVVHVLEDSTTKNYVKQLRKENAVMVKLILEKDKIIESNGLELQKLRINLQRMQLQNWHLAQSNTQMLAEINAAKDRLKVLQHDMACKDALYKAKMVELQEKEKVISEENITVKKVETKPENILEEQPELAGDYNADKFSKTKRGRSMRSQSLGCTSSHHAVDKEVAENKRRCLRRQSEKLRPLETRADLSDIEINACLTTSLEPHLEKDLEKAKMPSEVNSTLKEETKAGKTAVEQPEQANDKNDNEVSKPKREHATRSQSLGATSSQQAVNEEMAENKRRCLRRPDLFEIDVNTRLKSLTTPLHVSNSEGEDKKERHVKSSSRSLPERPSIGRPLRKAAEKIQSYEEPRLNTKMRRP